MKGEVWREKEGQAVNRRPPEDQAGAVPRQETEDFVGRDTSQRHRVQSQGVA